VSIFTESQRAELVEAAGKALSKTERQLLARAVKSPKGAVAVTTIRRTGRAGSKTEGAREMKAAESLLKKGLAVEVSRETETRPYHKRRSTAYITTLGIKLTPAGHAAAQS
jgi:hypothetical protein